MKSAVLVTLRKPGFMEQNIKTLLNEGYEVVVAADEPDSEVLDLIKKYGLKATISRERRGKWKALNDAVELTGGTFILFLDSDTRIVDLDDLDSRMANYAIYDAVEIRKEVNSSTTLERLVNIDYFLMFLISKFASKFNACLTLNGAAFGIRKDVLLSLGGFRRRITEDADLGLRLGLNDHRIAVVGRALTKAPSSFREWYVQKERWSLGGAEILFDNFWKILKRPRIWLSFTILFYPALIGLIFAFTMPDSLVLKLLYLVLPFILVIPSKMVSIALLTLFEVHTVKNIIAILFSFLLWASAVVILSKKTSFRIDYRLLPVYYFIYSPLWTMICLVSLVRVLVAKFRRGKIKLRDWVV